MDGEWAAVGIRVMPSPFANDLNSADAAMPRSPSERRAKLGMNCQRT